MLVNQLETLRVKLGMGDVLYVDRVGMSGGLALFWKEIIWMCRLGLLIGLILMLRWKERRVGLGISLGSMGT